jgi:hypothetical protein
MPLNFLQNKCVSYFKITSNIKWKIQRNQMMFLVLSCFKFSTRKGINTFRYGYSYFGKMHKDRKVLIFGGNACNIKRWWTLDNRKIDQKYCKMGETHLKPPSFSSKMGITCDFFFVWIGHMCVTKPKRGQVLTKFRAVASKW